MRIALLLALACSAGAQTLRITSPSSGTVVSPGQIIDVTVEGEGAYQLVFLVGELGIGEGRSSRPYQFRYSIPEGTAAGEYSLNGVGVIVRGEPIYTEPILLVSERAERPVRVKPDISHLVFSRVGESRALSVLGRYSDGTELNVTRSRKTTFRSADPAVASVSATGIVTATGAGSTHIVISDMYGVAVLVERPLIVRPPVLTMRPAEKRQFTVAKVDTSITNVVWSIEPRGMGRISASGMYTAPASVATRTTVLVTAANSDNSAQRATGSITLLPK